MTPFDSDLDRTRILVAELPALLHRAWSEPAPTLASKQDDSGGGGGKPGSRPPTRLDRWSHVQTTLDVARQLCADELDVYLASDRAAEALDRIPGLLEATDGDCAACLRCQHGVVHNLCRVGCTEFIVSLTKGTGLWVEVAAVHLCECRHGLITHQLARLHSTLRTALEMQPPKQDIHQGKCPQCASSRVAMRDNRVWCLELRCDFERRNVSFGIGIAMVTRPTRSLA